MPYGRISGGGGSGSSVVVSIDAEGFKHYANGDPPDKLTEETVQATGKTRIVHVVKDKAGNSVELAAIEY